MNEFLKNVGVGLVALAGLFGLGVLFHFAFKIKAVQTAFEIMALTILVLAISAWAGMLVRSSIVDLRGHWFRKKLAVIVREVGENGEHIYSVFLDGKFKYQVGTLNEATAWCNKNNYLYEKDW
jgi:hypothetical protein